MSNRAVSVILVLSVSLLTLGTPALADVDADAAVVLLRKDCGDPALENCFESMTELSNLSTGWIWTIRSPAPSATAPLLVEIGPGEFETFTCAGGGNVTLRGSGREQTILKGTFGADVDDCERLSFIDLGLHGTNYGVQWLNGGDSSWSNTDLLGLGDVTAYASSGWRDTCDPPFSKAVHYFHGSRVRVTGTGPIGGSVGFHSSCSENWFFGGEILADVAVPTNFVTGVKVDIIGDVRTFGTTIRARASAMPNNASLVGVLVSLFADPSGLPGSPAPGAFHAHGSIVNASLSPESTADVSAVGLEVVGGLAHTPGTAFVVKASGAGVATRVNVGGSGTALSPFLWQSGPKPPQSPDESTAVFSSDGKDLFVETDCDAAGDCDGGGNETHLMVYNEAECGATDPWFDIVTGRCRGT